MHEQCVLKAGLVLLARLFACAYYFDLEKGKPYIKGYMMIIRDVFPVGAADKCIKVSFKNIYEVKLFIVE